jgi:2-polyprenyl-6-methoxyphenol hydroxylase-like FAD-dependent oxidoreductase
MAPALDVCIRGAGIVGRTLALLLASERLRVGLVGQPPAPHGDLSDVRAYALNPASRDLLTQLRAWPDEGHATPVSGMRVHGDEGGAVSFDADTQAVPALAWIVDVAALQQRLGEALRYQPLVERLDAPQPAALTVVCEGRTSATRAEFGVGFHVTSYGQRAIAARLDCEQSHGFLARQWFHGGEVLALLPLGGAAGGAGNSVALVWSVRDDRADALLALEPAPAAAARG